MKKTALALAMILGAPGVAEAQTITNGSFELGADPGLFTTLFPGDSTSITGWTVGGTGRNASIDYIGTYWEASDGVRSLDLSGNGPGTISQMISGLTIGRNYRISFDIAGNPDGGLGDKTLVTLAAIGGNAQIDTFTVDASVSRQDMNWQGRSYIFAPVSTSVMLTFASATPTAFGPALDNVSLAAVPEPAAWGLMILGVGAVGGSLRRRPRGVARFA